jgi:hypothetical protein
MATSTPMPTSGGPTRPGPARDKDTDAARVRAERWDRIKAQVQANWTGILGAVILVVGIAFFGVLASMFIGPEGRFALIVGLAVLLLVASRWLLRHARQDVWRPFATWLTGVAGAIALFACVGAGGIDGLRFIDEPLPALALLATGIAINLALAYATRVEQVAALHVVLSLCALAVSPATPLVLLIATAVAFFGIGLSYRSRWDVNLLLILVAFAAFHAYWLDRTPLALADARPFGLPCTLLIGLGAALVHYRESYRSTRLDALPFGVHVFNWTLFGVNVVRYSTGSVWAVPALAAAALVATLLGRLGRRRGIRWLFVTDTLVGQVLAIFAILRLGRLDLADLDVALLAFLEVALFHVVCSIEREILLVRVLYGIEWLAALAVIGYGLDSGAGNVAALGHAPDLAARLAILAVVIIAQMHVYTARGLALDTLELVFGGIVRTDRKAPSILTLCSAPLLLLAYVAVADVPGAQLAMTAVLAGLFVYRRAFETVAFDWSVLTATVLFHVLVWSRMHALMPDGAQAVALAGGPLLLLDVAVLQGRWLWSDQLGRYLARPAVYLLALHAAAMVYALTNGISDFVPGVAYLLLSLVAVEASSAWRRRAAARPVAPTKRLDELALHAGWFFLALALGRHLLVHLQSEATLGPVPVRLAIELLALGVLLYWLSYAPAIERATVSLVSRVLSPYLWEVVLAFLTLTLAIELDQVWHPVAWGVLACGLFVFGRRRSWPVRVVYESWLFLVAAAAHLAFVSSTFATPDSAWTARPEIVGILAVLLQIAYVVLVYRGGGFPSDDAASRAAAPRALAPLQSYAVLLFARRRNMLVFYPVIAALAIFLFWRFEKAVLTLLWVAEVFVVFALGIFLREKHFVRVALVCLALCIVRLIGYDLAQTNLAVRAGVFVGVGVLMLGINALYRKFSHRIQG